MTLAEKEFRGVTPDETRSTRDEDMHMIRAQVTDHCLLAQQVLHCRGEPAAAHFFSVCFT
jgi:hypothetical protein